MTEIPQEVVLGPFRYRVSIGNDEDWQKVEQLEHRQYGYSDHMHGLILINRNTTKATRQTALMHEIMHAAVFASGSWEDEEHGEERWIQQVAPLLLDALQRSPGLVEYLAP